MHKLKVKNQSSNSKLKHAQRAVFSYFAFNILHFDFARRRRGFTLLEVIIAMGIFSVAIVAAIGAMLSANNAQIKATNIQNIQDNLRFALESMTKEMRTGTNFIGNGGIIPYAYNQITFTRSDGAVVTYCLQNVGEIGVVKKVNGSTTDCSLGSPLTSEVVTIEQLVFYLIGETPGPADGQPRITISMRARSENPKLATTFHLQTTVTQRIRDL